MKRIDATKGPLVKLIFAFAIPLMLTTFAQQLFSLIDTVVLGNMANTNAVASVGATNPITNLILTGFIGLSSGTSIVLARYIGQKNDDKVKKTIDTAILGALGLGILTAIIGIALAPTFLRMTDCPEECFDGAVLYTRVIIAAAPATLLYNYGASILRALGDTKHPLMYIMISGVTNVVLNVLLCLTLENKVAAVALATAASKLISAILVIIRLIRMDDIARIDIRNMKFDKSSFLLILRYGVPNSISNLIIPVANLQIVPAINSYGIEAVAGNSAAASIMNLPGAITGAFGSATTTFMGQNIGAEKPDRTKKSFYYCLVINTVIGAVTGAFFVLSGRYILAMMLGADATVAIEYGMLRLTYVASFIFISAANAVIRGGIHAYGYPVAGSIASLVSTLVFRIIWMQLIYPIAPSFVSIMICFTISWVLNMIFCTVFIAILNRRYSKGIYRHI